MKYTTLAFLLLLNFFVTAQEIRISSQLGVATGEMKDRKKLMLFRSTNVGTEFALEKDKHYLTVALAVSRLKFDYEEIINTNIFSKKNFLHLPATYKRYFSVSPKSKLFLDFGFQATYFFSELQETRSNGTLSTQRKRNIGWSFGPVSAIGLKTMITRNTFFDIGFGDSFDIWTRYSNDSDRIKTTRWALISSLCLKL